MSFLTLTEALAIANAARTGSEPSTALRDTYDKAEDKLIEKLKDLGVDEAPVAAATKTADALKDTVKTMKAGAKAAAADALLPVVSWANFGPPLFSRPTARSPFLGKSKNRRFLVKIADPNTSKPPSCHVRSRVRTGSLCGMPVFQLNGGIIFFVWIALVALWTDGGAKRVCKNCGERFRPRVEEQPLLRPLLPLK